MKTLVIDKDRLISCLMEQNHAGAIPSQWPYLVAFNPDKDSPIQARIIWADTPSSQGGYFANFKGETNHALWNFLDDYMHTDYHWDDSDEIGDVQDFYSSNLLDEVELDGERYKVKYEN